MDKSVQKWNNILMKIQTLVEYNQQLKSHLTNYEQELTDVKKNFRKVQQENESLLEQLNITKLAKGVGLNGDESMKVKAQIKSYIQEIDEILAGLAR